MQQRILQSRETFPLLPLKKFVAQNHQDFCSQPAKNHPKGIFFERYNEKVTLIITREGNYHQEGADSPWCFLCTHSGFSLPQFLVLLAHGSFWKIIPISSRVGMFPLPISDKHKATPKEMGNSQQGVHSSDGPSTFPPQL